MKKTGTDHVKTLANALKYLENTSGIEEETQIVTEPDEENICVTIYNLARELNESIKSTGKKIKDIFPDYEKVSEFNLTNLLFTIDPKLFAFVFLVTMSAKECKLLDEAEIDWNSPGWLLNLVDFDNNNSYTRLIRRVFICYALVFTRNPADKSPLHIAISDNIEKYSGSSELIRNLNKLGICLNGESFSEFKKNVVADLRQTGSLGVPNTLDPRLFFAVSADNTDINFVHSTIRDENGLARSYHALGSMLSIPSPNLFQARAQESADDNEPNLDLPEDDNEPNLDLPKKLSKRKIAKALQLPPTQIPTYIKPIIQQSNPHLPPSINVENFKVTSECDLKLKNDVENRVLTLCCMKTFHDEKSCCNVKPSLKVALKTQGYSSPVGLTCNLSLINSPPDAVKTLKVWLDFLKKEVVDRYNLDKLLVVGDGKTFGNLLTIINDYPIDYAWVQLYLGEFHRNMVYMRCLLKNYAGAGLQQLAKETYAGATLTKVLNVGHYRKSLGFLLYMRK